MVCSQNQQAYYDGNIDRYNIDYCERKVSGTLNAHNQTKKVFTTKLPKFSYFFMLLLHGGHIEICSGPPNTLSVFCNSRGFKVVHQNVRGIRSNHHLLKSLVNKTEPKMMMMMMMI